MRFKRASLTAFLVAIGLVSYAAVSLAKIEIKTSPEKKTAHPEIKVPNEDQRFAPSYITIDGKKHPSVDDWTDPRLCGQCHTEQYKGWNGSMHSNAFKDPVFQALWAIGEKSGSELNLTNHCGSCHSPIGVATGTITFKPDEGLHGAFEAPGVAAMGVSCDVCHTISGTNLNKTAVLEHGNASFEISPGEVKRATLDDSESPYHKTEYSDHHSSSKFCGNCHNIFHPGNNFPIERTYDEWKYSIYAQNDIQCQDCHMVPVEVAEKVADTLKRPQELLDAATEGFAGLGGKMRKVIHKHGFVGGNAVITQVMRDAKLVEGGEEASLGAGSNYEMAVKRLQGAASLKVAMKKKTGHLHQLKVRVTNERAGHNLPTSLTEVREVWLEVSVTDDKGNELFSSGKLSAENELPAETVVFNAHAVDKDGNHTHLPWEITRFTDVNTIPPKGYKYAKYYFNIPDDTEKVFSEVTLRYRSFSQGLADLLLGKGKITVPNVPMVIDKQTHVVSTLKQADKVARKEEH